MAECELVEPSVALLPGYVAALETGWSPNTGRDVSGEHLAAIRADADGFIADLTRREGGVVTLKDGSQKPRLPGRVFWIWDGEFCGAINIRFVPGTEDLPPHVSGHIGYAVVPWKRNRGYARRALRLMLAVARDLGMPRVLITCDDDNVVSQRVIEANGGQPAGEAIDPDHFEQAQAAVLGADRLELGREDVTMQNAMMRAAMVALLSLVSLAARAADYPAQRSGDWVAHDFRFHTGQTIAELHLHYTTVGASTGEPVLILHGTGGTGSGMLTPGFAGELFGPGQPLDAGKYFIILPDTIGTGQSTKPSDGMRAKFPEYDYNDLVLAQYRLLTEGMGVHHLRLVLGNSMGGMETWVWGIAYPGFMDALVPMASQPTAMAARNWMLRRMLIESIRQDPAYQDGNYTTQPPSLRIANVFFGLATNGGTLALQARAPTHALANKVVDDGLAAKPPADANDFIYQWNASADYDPEPMLNRIEAPVLAINSADDERNPPQTGVTHRALTQVKNARLYLIPASTETHGHGTTGYAKFWAPKLADFLPTVPHRPVTQ